MFLCVGPSGGLLVSLTLLQLLLQELHFAWPWQLLHLCLLTLSLSLQPRVTLSRLWICKQRKTKLAVVLPQSPTSNKISTCSPGVAHLEHQEDSWWDRLVVGLQQRGAQSPCSHSQTCWLWVAFPVSLQRFRVSYCQIIECIRAHCRHFEPFIAT